MDQTISIWFKQLLLFIQSGEKYGRSKTSYHFLWNVLTVQKHVANLMEMR